METREYNGLEIESFVHADGTTQWRIQVKCHSGCCDKFITRGTLASLMRHVDQNIAPYRKPKPRLRSRERK